MSAFACIYFNEDNILLSKVCFEEMNCVGANGYNVFVPKASNDMTYKEWFQLEKQLKALNVEYVVMDLKENPFDTVIQVKGYELKCYLSLSILHYIYKYKLIPKNKLYANIGIIVGRVGESLDVAASILNEVTDLTFFLNEPIIYKEILQEIYEKTRLKAKAKVPCSIHLRDMDVIFDLAGNGNYAKWCKPTAIYIDFKNYIGKKGVQFEKAPPSIWHDFDIRCGRQQYSISMIQAAFYAQGIYKGNFLNEMKRMNISIDTIYNTCIS